jgi:hypothetical protein
MVKIEFPLGQLGTCPTHCVSSERIFLNYTLHIIQLPYLYKLTCRLNVNLSTHLRNVPHGEFKSNVQCKRIIKKNHSLIGHEPSCNTIITPDSQIVVKQMYISVFLPRHQWEPQVEFFCNYSSEIAKCQSINFPFVISFYIWQCFGHIAILFCPITYLVLVTKLLSWDMCNLCASVNYNHY